MASQRAGSCKQQTNIQHELQPMAAIEQLGTRLPARKQQIGQLVRLLGRPQQQGSNVFVHGAPKSGKSTVVREVLQALGRKHAYFAVGETTKPKQLFSSILSQLLAVKRKREHGYTGVACDNVVDFANSLASACPASKPTAFIVLDGVQLLARTPLLAAMMQAHVATGANVAFILVSSVPLSSQYFEGVEQMVMPQVYFPAYTEEELISILVQDAASAVANVLRGSSDSKMLSSWGAGSNAGTPHYAKSGSATADTRAALYTSLYKAFISGVVLPNFMPTTRSLCDLRAVAAHLWPAYVQPLGKEVEMSNDHESVVRKLRTCIRQRVNTTLQALQPGMTHAHLIHAAVLQMRGVSAAKGGSATDAASAHTQHMHDWGALPMSAKLLVVAGYIASHNKASHDKAMFEAGPRRGRVRGARAALDADRQAEAAKEARLKGPSPFTLHRLLYIYQVLYRSADHMNAATGIGGGGTSLAAFQAQGLHSLRPSFIVTASSLRSLHEADQQSRRCNHGSVAAGYGAAASLLAPLPCRDEGQPGGCCDNSQLQAATQQPGVVAAGTQGQLKQSQGQSQMQVDADADAGAQFTALLMEAQQKIDANKSKGARTKAKKGASAANAASELAIASLVPGFGATSAAGAGRAGAAAFQFESASAQMPHPASGVARHGALAVSPDAAPLLHDITALTTMGLLKRGAADDMLEAPRLSLGSVDEHLAAALARDCGVKLHSFLKYA